MIVDKKIWDRFASKLFSDYYISQQGYQGKKHPKIYDWGTIFQQQIDYYGAYNKIRADDPEKFDVCIDDENKYTEFMLRHG